MPSQLSSSDGLQLIVRCLFLTNSYYVIQLQAHFDHIPDEFCTIMIV